MKKQNGQWVYDRVEMQVAGNIVIKLLNTTIRDARQTMRKWLDDHNVQYGSLVAYRKDKAVLISGVRDTANKKSPVATASIG